MLTIVTFDFETIAPDYTPPVDDPNHFAPLGKHVPVCASWLVSYPQDRVASDGGSMVRNWKWELTSALIESEADEKAVLAELCGHLAGAGKIVTWNGRGFDVPLLGMRAMRYGLDCRWWPKKWHRNESRSWADGSIRHALVHYDMMDILGLHGGARGIAMADVARSLGLPAKREMDGSQVGTVWKHPDKRDRIGVYCAEDVVEEYLIYLNWVFSFEAISQEKVKEHMAGFMAWLRSSPETVALRPWIEAYDQMKAAHDQQELIRPSDIRVDDRQDDRTPGERFVGSDLGDDGRTVVAVMEQKPDGTIKVVDMGDHLCPVCGTSLREGNHGEGVCREPVNEHEGEPI